VPDQIYAQSSDLDRTIITAQICLAGMFPAENGTAWNPDLNWQPVPLRTIATEHDNVNLLYFLNSYASIFLTFRKLFIFC